MRGAKGGKSDKCMGVSQLSRGHVPGLPPKVYAYVDLRIIASLIFMNRINDSRTRTVHYTLLYRLT